MSVTNPAYGGVGAGGGGFVVPDSAAIPFVDDPARDAWATANPGDLIKGQTIVSVYTTPPDVVWYLWNGESDPAVYNPADWVDATPIIQGSAGPAGASGNSFFFTGIGTVGSGDLTTRDGFFSDGTNSTLLKTHLPVTVNEEGVDGSRVTVMYEWVGQDSPASYDIDLWRPSTLGTAPGSIVLGREGASISSGLNVMNFTDANGNKEVVLAQHYTPGTDDKPYYFKFGTEITIPVATVQDQTLPDPSAIQITSGANSYATAFTFIPKTSGTLRVESFQGADDTGAVFIDNRFEILAGQIDTEVTLVIPNPTTSFISDQQYVRWSGIQVAGGLQTTGPLAGQTAPWQNATVSLLEFVNIGDMEKSVYDTTDSGIVDAGQNIEDFAIVKETAIDAGKLVAFNTDPLVDGVASVVLASANNPARNKSVGMAIESGNPGDVIRIVQYGLVEGLVSTASFVPNTVLYLTTNGNFSDSPPQGGRAQQIGYVRTTLTLGSVLVTPGQLDKEKFASDAFEDGELLRFDSASGEIVGTGMIDDGTQVQAGDRQLYVSELFTEPGSVNVGAGLTLSDNGGFLIAESKVSGNSYTNLDSKLDATGSARPTWSKRELKQTGVPIQSDNSVDLSISSYVVSNLADEEVSKIYLSFHAAQTNFRFEIVSNETGQPIRYYPSQYDFVNGLGDTFTAGFQNFEFAPISVPAGIDLTINFFADEPIALKGDALNNPWYSIDRQLYTEQNVVTVYNDTMERFGSEKSTKVSSGLNITPDGSLGVATTFTVAAGTVDYFESVYNFDNINSSVVEFAESSGIAPIYSDPIMNWIVARSDGVIDIRTAPPSNVQRRSECLIGIVTFNGAVINSVIPVNLNYRQVGNQVIDFMEAIGNLKVDGLDPEPATAGGLTLSHTAGEIFGSNINFTDSLNPHEKSFAAQDPITNMSIYLGDGTQQATGLSDVDPSNYNPSGGVTYTSMPGGANETQIIKIYIQVDSGEIIYIPGQTTWNNLSSAIADFNSYRPVLPLIVTAGAVKLGSIIIRKGATDLTDENDAIFVATTKFGDLNPLAAPVSDIEPTPFDGNMVYYDLSLGKLVDAKIAASAEVKASSFTLTDDVYKRRCIIEPLANMTITLPDAYSPPNANYEIEFINSRRAFGGWNTTDKIVTVTWNDGVDDYFVELTPDELKGDYDYESYTFRFDFNEWRFTYNG